MVPEMKEIECQLALENFKRRIISLNFDGYFTKAFFMEFKEILNLNAAYRVFFNKNGKEKNKVHMYHSEPVADKRRNLEKIRETLSGLRHTLVDFTSGLPGNLFLIKVYECDIGCCLFSCKDDHCHRQKSNTEVENKQNIHSLIVLFENEDLAPNTQYFFDNTCTYRETVQILFQSNEEPPCYGRKTDHSPCLTEAKKCFWENRCNPKRSNLHRSGETVSVSSLTTDEVLHELKNKLSGIFGDHPLFIMTYQANMRILCYRDTDKIDYFKLESNRKFIEFKNYANELINEVEDDFKNEVKFLIDTFFPEHDDDKASERQKIICDAFEKLQNAVKSSVTFDKFECSIDSARILFKHAIQRVDHGITSFLWETFESYSNDIGNIINIGKEISTVETAQQGEKFRKFCEDLFLGTASDNDVLVVTPLGYTGQKLGIIMALIKSDKIEKDEKKVIEKRFLNLTSEFAPLLFHSLQDQMYRDALILLKESHPKNLVDILCQVLPTCFNVTAIVFHSEKGEKFVYGFPSAKEGTPFQKIKVKNENFQVIEEATFDESELYTVKSLRNGYLGPYSDVAEHKKIRTRSHLLFRIDDRNTYVEGKFSITKGVLDLYFDLSEYSLRRNAPDIVRELEYMTNLLTEAASQKMAVLEHGIKSATNAIISRNHSHHIGSHVTPRTSVEKIIERLKEIYPERFNYTDTESPEDKYNKIELREKYVHALKLHMDEYVQKKADFMAEIATVPVTTTISKTLFKEVLPYFLHNSLLMDNIGANEGFYYIPGDTGSWHNRLKFRFLNNGNEVKVKFTLEDKEGRIEKTPYNHWQIPYASGHLSSFGDIDGLDVAIAWPGPLGEFALYSFLENFIRNSVKHNYDTFKNTPNEDLVISINVSEFKPDHPAAVNFYRIQIWDSISDPEREVPSKEETTLKLWKRLQKAVDQSIVENDGSLKSGNWGVAEMKIMATLMRGSDDFISMSENLEIKSEEKEGKLRLVYEFWLMKAKELLIISNKLNKGNIPEKPENGIYCFQDLDSFKKAQLSAGADRSPAVYDIAILDKEALQGSQGLSHLLPYRVLYEQTGDNRIPGSFPISTDELAKLNPKDNDCKAFVWRAWTNNILRQNECTEHWLAIYFEQENTVSPTEEWSARAEDIYDNGGQFTPKLCVIDSNGGVTPDPAIAKGHKFICYDRHFNGVKSLDTGGVNITFHEAFDKSSTDFTPIFSSKPTDEIICQLAEAGSLSILFVDERVTEVAYEEPFADDAGNADSWYGSRQRLAACLKANILIATHLVLASGTVPVHKKADGKFPRICVKIAPNNKTMDVYFCREDKKGLCNAQFEQRDKTNSTTCHGYDTDCPGCTRLRTPNCLIMHQGITETLLKKTITTAFAEEGVDKEDFRKALIAFVHRVQNVIPYVAIDSGRGIPANLPKSVKFIPFSLISEYVMKKRLSKYNLIRNLMSITRREDEQGATL